MSDSNTDQDFYRYDPSLPAAAIFVTLFACTAFLHFYQLLRTRTWYFIPFVIGGFFELVGYIGRIVSSRESPHWTLGPYLIQTLCILLAPALFSASVYMELGRIILLVDGEKYSIIKKRWMTKLFVLGDIVSFMTQSSGGGLMASGKEEDINNGAHIVISGLLIQILFFGFFIAVMVIFNRRMKKHPTEKYRSLLITTRKNMRALYVTSILIMIRNIFRTVEYIQGQEGYLLRHEYYLYIFDAVLMFGVMLVFNVVHPSEIKALLRGGMVSKGFKMVTLENGQPQIREGAESVVPQENKTVGRGSS